MRDAITPIGATPTAGGEPSVDGARLPLDVVVRNTPAGPRAPSPGRFASLRLLPFVVLALPVGGFIGLYFQPPGLQLLMRTLQLEPGAGTSTPMAVAIPRPAAEAPPPAPTIAGLGVLVPRGEVVAVAPPYGAGDARIAELLVEEGQRVERGQVLAVLDNRAVLEAAIATASAQLSARQATLEQVRASVTASRDEARAAVARAEAALVHAQRELQRATELRARGVESQASLETRRAAHDQAEQDVRHARATLQRFEGTDLEQQPDVVVAQRNLEVAQADLLRIKADLTRAFVLAPQAGTVLRIHVRPGANPGSRGILNLADLDEMTAELEIYQGQIGGVALGAQVTLTADALPGTLHGSVTRIGLEVGRQTLTEATPAANTDARVVKVYVSLDAPSTEVARRFSNLQVIARIEGAAAK